MHLKMTRQPYKAVFVVDILHLILEQIAPEISCTFCTNFSGLGSTNVAILVV